MCVLQAESSRVPWVRKGSLPKNDPFDPGPLTLGKKRGSRVIRVS